MIEVKGLYKDFGALHVLRGVSLNVEQGDIISIIGPSGSGKSTLLRSINLLEKPTYGEIWVEGKLITPPDPYLHWDVIRASKTYGELRAQGMEDELAIMKIKKEDLLKPREGMAYQRLMKQIMKDHFEDTYSVRRRVGMVFQHFNLFPHMTVLENMIYAPMKVNKVPKEQAVAKARELLDNVGMLSKINAYPASSPAVRSSGSPLRGRWPWSRTWYFLTSPLPPLTRRWSRRSWRSSKSWPRPA